MRSTMRPGTEETMREFFGSANLIVFTPINAHRFVEAQRKAKPKPTDEPASDASPETD
jgi:hypothetical protein